MNNEISSWVWIGCLALLFLAIAIHEGWFSGFLGGASSSPPIITSGSAGSDQYAYGVTF